MVLNPVGELAQKFWNMIPEEFPFIILDGMVVMPNHVHGVLWIDNIDGGDAINRVCTDGGVTGINNPMFYENISRVMRWLKGRCTFEINKKYPDTNFGQQSRFYDHIIQNEKSLENIRGYIINNPAKWQRDRNNKNGLCM